MEQSGKKALKSGVWYTVSNFIVKGIGFLTAPVFNRIMSINAKGEWDNFSTWAGVMVMITSLNLEASLIRAKFDYKENIDKYVVSMMYLSTISTMLWYIIYLIFRKPVTNLFSMDSVYIDIMFVYLFLSPIIQIFQTVERIQFKYKWTVFISMSLALSTTLLSLFFVFHMKNKTDGRIIGFVAPVLIIGLIIYLHYIKKRNGIDITCWKYALKISLPFIPHLLSMFILSSVDRIMIKKMCGSSDLALYSTAGTIGSIIAVLITSVNGAYSPWLGEKLNQKDYKAIKKVSIPYVLLFTYMTCCIALATPELLYIIGGQKYMAAKYVMLPIVGGCFFQFVYCMYVNVEQYEMKTKGMAVASVISALINLMLNYIYIPKYGYIAAAYTTLACYFILLIFHMVLVYSIKMSHVYYNYAIMAISLITITVILLSGLLIEKMIIRWIILLISCLIGLIGVWKNWSKIKGFLAKRK